MPELIIDEVACRKQAKELFNVSIGSNIVGTTIGAVAFNKMSKTKKHKTLKTVGVGLLSGLIAGNIGSYVYTKNLKANYCDLDYYRPQTKV
jgi:hypothetical protein